MKKILLTLCSVSLLLIGCQPPAQETEAAREEVVETTILKTTDVARELNLSSTLEGYVTMNVSPSVTGIIQKINVQVGSMVKKGDVLVQMDPQQYNNTKLTYENLKTDVTRMQSLVATGVISQQAYDQSVMAMNQAAESLRFLEENTFVKAGMSGAIALKNYEPGELYSGQPILVIATLNPLRLYVNVPENYYPQVKMGMKTSLTSDVYPGETFVGTVDLISPVVDPASHTFSVRIKIPNDSQKLHPGMYCHASISLAHTNALLVPYQSVQKLTGANDRFIYLNDNGRAKRVFVTLGDRYDDMIEVIADEVKEGVEVITTGADKLVDGVSIKVANVY